MKKEYIYLGAISSLLGGIIGWELGRTGTLTTVPSLFSLVIIFIILYIILFDNCLITGHDYRLVRHVVCKKKEGVENYWSLPFAGGEVRTDAPDPHKIEGPLGRAMDAADSDEGTGSYPL